MFHLDWLLQFKSKTYKTYLLAQDKLNNTLGVFDECGQLLVSPAETKQYENEYVCK